MSNVFHALTDNDTVRTVFIAIVTGALGWGSHAVMELNVQSQRLETHDKQLQVLFEGQNRTHQALQDLNTTIVRVEGKIDVVNQKIDDDRDAKKRK
jgi:hypothetical protein